MFAGRSDARLTSAAPHTILLSLLTSRASAALMEQTATAEQQRAVSGADSLIECMKRAASAPLLAALEPVVASGKVGRVAVATAAEVKVSRMHMAFRRSAVNTTHLAQINNPFTPFASFQFQVMSLSALNPVVLNGVELARDTWHTIGEGSVLRLTRGAKRVDAYYNEVERRARRTAAARLASINAGGSGDDGTFVDPCAGLPPVVVPMGVAVNLIASAYVFTQAASAAELAQVAGPVVAAKPDISIAQVRSDLELFIAQKAQARCLIIQAELEAAAGASAAVGTKRKAGAAALDDDEAAEELKKQKTVTGAITDQCTCPVCASLMQDAVSLNCGHVMCEGCVAEWFRRANKKACPTCRASHRGELKTAYLVRDVVANLEQLTLTAEERAERAAAAAERTAERRSREEAAAKRKEAIAAAKAARAAAARGPVIHIGGGGAGAGADAMLGAAFNAFDAAIRRGGPAVRAAAAAADAAPAAAAGAAAPAANAFLRNVAAADARNAAAAAAAAAAPVRAPIGRLRAIDLDSDDEMALFAAPGEFQF